MEHSRSWKEILFSFIINTKLHFKGKSCIRFLLRSPKTKVQYPKFLLRKAGIAVACRNSGDPVSSLAPLLREARVPGRRGSGLKLFAPFWCAVPFPIAWCKSCERERDRSRAPAAPRVCRRNERWGMRLHRRLTCKCVVSDKCFIFKVFLLILDNYFTSFSIGRIKGVKRIKAKPFNLRWWSVHGD